MALGLLSGTAAKNGLHKDIWCQVSRAQYLCVTTVGQLPNPPCSHAKAHEMPRLGQRFHHAAHRSEKVGGNWNRTTITMCKHRRVAAGRGNIDCTGITHWTRSIAVCLTDTANHKHLMQPQGLTWPSVRQHLLRCSIQNLSSRRKAHVQCCQGGIVELTHAVQAQSSTCGSGLHSKLLFISVVPAPAEDTLQAPVDRSTNITAHRLCTITQLSMAAGANPAGVQHS